MLAPPPPQSLSSSSLMSGGMGGGGGEKQRKSIRCYICGGETGLECRDIPEPGWKSPYVRPEPLSAKDGRSPVIRTCDGVISNKGCIKQVVNDGEWCSLLSDAIEVCFTLNFPRDFFPSVVCCPRNFEVICRRVRGQYYTSCLLVCILALVRSREFLERRWTEKEEMAAN